MYNTRSSPPRHPRLRRFTSNVVPWIICPPLVAAGVLIVHDIWPEEEVPAEPPGFEVLDGMCEKPEPQGLTAAYKGEGPHRYTVSGSEDLGAILMDSLFDPFETVPGEWEAEDLDATELVVCVDIELKDSLAHCDYEIREFELGGGEVESADEPESMTGELHAADYRFRVYTASTGDLIDETTKHADDDTCPGELANYEVSETRDIAAALEDDVAKEFLEPWVTATVE